MGTHPRAVPSGHLTWQLLWPHAGLSRKGAGLPLPAAPGWLLPSGPGAPAHSQKGHSTSDLGQGNTVGRSCPLLASKGMAPQPVGLWGKLPEPSSNVPSLTDFPALPPETHGLRKHSCSSYVPRPPASAQAICHPFGNALAFPLCSKILFKCHLLTALAQASSFCCIFPLALLGQSSVLSPAACAHPGVICS